MSSWLTGFFVEMTTEVIAAAAIAATAAVVTLVRRRRRQVSDAKATELIEAERANDDREQAARYRRLRDHVQADKQLWRFGSFARFKGQPKPRIVTVMNFKGGVGKSTLTANLGAYFALQRRLRVLLIDLDYQASLSSFFLPLPPMDASAPPALRVHDLIRCHRPNASTLRRMQQAIVQVPVQLPRDVETATLDLIGSNPALAEVEENQQLRWLLKDTSDDVRSRLRRILWSTTFENYDLIMLDAPPRLSLAAVAGLVASTHYIVPTRPQILSTQGAVGAIRQVSALSKEIGARVELCGIVQNLTTNRSTTAAERQEVHDLRQELEQQGIRPHMFKTVIPDSSAISHPDSAALAYLQRGRSAITVQTYFNNLGEELAHALQLGEKDKEIRAIPVPSM